MSEVSILKQEGIHIFSGAVNEATCKAAIEFILEENLKKENRLNSLTLFINSNGGSIPDGFGLIDVMRGSSIPVRTVGVGMIASMGLLLLMAGAKGHRVIAPNTTVLSHQFSWGVYGKEHELIAGQSGVDFYQNVIMEHYKRCTGLSEKKIRDNLLPANDVWLTAKEAKKFNLVDKVKDV